MALIGRTDWAVVSATEEGVRRLIEMRSGRVALRGILYEPRPPTAFLLL